MLDSDKNTFRVTSQPLYAVLSEANPRYLSNSVLGRAKPSCVYIVNSKSHLQRVGPKHLGMCIRKPRMYLLRRKSNYHENNKL